MAFMPCALSVRRFCRDYEADAVEGWSWGSYPVNAFAKPRVVPITCWPSSLYSSRDVFISASRSVSIAWLVKFIVSTEVMQDIVSLLQVANHIAILDQPAVTVLHLSYS